MTGHRFAVNLTFLPNVNAPDYPRLIEAIIAAMRAQLAEELARIETRAKVRVVIIHGAGKGFSVDVDLKEPPDKRSREVLETEFRPFLECIWASKKLYIAAVHSHAAGIGAALAQACDFVTMDAEAKLTRSFEAIDLVPDGGLVWHLNRAIGAKRALQAIVEGQRLVAQLCLSCGLVNKLLSRAGH